MPFVPSEDRVVALRVEKRAHGGRSTGNSGEAGLYYRTCENASAVDEKFAVFGLGYRRSTWNITTPVA
jgi:hypothetical protein